MEKKEFNKLLLEILGVITSMTQLKLKILISIMF